MPRIVVDAAFGSNPTDASYAWTTIGDTDSPDTSMIRSLTYSRGRDNERAQVETGNASLIIHDPDSDLDPDNTGSPYYPDVRPMLPIRARALIGSTYYPMCLQYVERLPRTLRVTDSYTERAIDMVDGFAWLAMAGLAGQSYAQEATGTRFAHVLDDVSWPSSLRSLDAGNTTVDAVTFTDDDAMKALTHLLAVVDTENGLAFADAQGRVRLIERHALIATPYTVSQATFGDASRSSGYAYQDLVPSYDLDNTVNEWRGTRSGGVTQIASDSSSQTTYGLRTDQFDSLATTDGEVLNQAQWKLRTFKSPLNRVQRISVMPGDNTAAWETLLSLEVGDRITVLETPPGFAAEQSTDHLIERIEVTVPPGLLEQARFTYELWPADTGAWLILDDLTAGELDSYALAY